MKSEKFPAGTTGYATIRGRRHWCVVDRANRKGVRVRFIASDPTSCWRATDVATVRDFERPRAAKAGGEQ